MTETRHSQILEAFQAFIVANPHVYTLFERYALEVAGAGHRNYSAKAVVERLRWHLAFEVKDSEVRINNNFTCHFARLFHARNPEHGSLFRNRVQSSKERAAVYPDKQVFIAPSEV